MVSLNRLYYFLVVLLFYSPLPAQTISGVINAYRKVSAIDTAHGIVKLANASNCTQYIGYSVMLIQMKGASMDASNTSSFGNITAINNAGRFEIGRMCGQLSDSIILETKIQNFYDVSGLVQLVFIPRFTNVTVVGTLKAAPWDQVADTGGIVAIEASGTITLNAGVSADSAGFRGGAVLNQSGLCSNFLAATDYSYPSTGTYLSGAKKGEGIADYIVNNDYGKGKQVNGGGGGNNANNGGGGGSNYSIGGTGGNKSTGCSQSNPGVGGLALSSYGYSTSNFRIFFGGGGGAGHENDTVATPGGHGGGIVYIKTNSIINVGNKITANGSVGYNPANAIYSPYDPYSSLSDGGGGGGAGGVVILQASSIINALTIESKGARGCNTEVGGTPNCAGPGGGGGGGFVWLSSPTIPGNVTIDVSGGANGLIKGAACFNSPNGATSGSAGSSAAGFAFPALKDSSPLCKQILPFALIVSFIGNIQNNLVHLSLAVSDQFQTRKCVLEYSADGIYFSDLVQLPGNNLPDYQFTDNRRSMPSYYRVRVYTISGTIQYSNIVYFSPLISKNEIALFPNPASSNTMLYINHSFLEPGTITMYDQLGRKVFITSIQLHQGENTVPLSTSSLNKGVYRVLLSTKSKNLWGSFVHY